MVLTWSGERKRVVYEGEDIGVLYLVEPRWGNIRGYWLAPEMVEPIRLGEWATLEEAYEAMDRFFLGLVGGEGEDESP
ncbi:hypothetical protein [Thermus caldifontis]|uniref:hypothetical protein n=1 Tax=Thermus caldifontis TaxID=1930763 RepID=UPI000DF1A467|nr:hypothetical protein [Thermus caldifontis]